MGLRVRKIISLGLLHINLSKSGVSLSFGAPGLTVNVGPSSTSGTIGLPGSGVSYKSRLLDEGFGTTHGAMAAAAAAVAAAVAWKHFRDVPAPDETSSETGAAKKKQQGSTDAAAAAAAGKQAKVSEVVASVAETAADALDSSTADAAKPKRVMTDEHKAKMKAGREAARANKAKKEEATGSPRGGVEPVVEE